MYYVLWSDFKETQEMFNLIELDKSGIGLVFVVIKQLGPLSFILFDVMYSKISFSTFMHHNI